MSQTPERLALPAPRLATLARVGEESTASVGDVWALAR